MKPITRSLEVAGRLLSFEVGRLAGRSTAAVLARYGDTTVLATVVMGGIDNKKDYFPLSVDFQERLYAGGRIKGSRWVKREGRPTDAEVLSGRLVDRSIRPLFPKGFNHEIQVIVTVLSTDTDNDADVLAVNAASAALAVSPIPWAGPIGCARVGLVEGQIVANPKNGDEAGAELDLVVSSTGDLIHMIEVGAKEIPEEKIMTALEIGFSENKKVIALIEDLAQTSGREKIPIFAKEHNPDLVSRVHAAAKDMVGEAVSPAKNQSILDREYAFALSKDNIAMEFEDREKAEVKEIIDEMFTAAFRKNILENKIRADGREVDEIRPLRIEVGVIPRVHGSALFQRGETQALTITTLGAPSLYQSLESAEGEEQKRYMHHYNFPPFSTGEIGRVGNPGRREIGHGALAERALAPVIPVESDFPYAIRVVSEILSSNGSTSMASTCGSTLSLMDAGVPIKAPVAGISIGLITPEGYPQKTDGYLLLTDINGSEDHCGDMDFKVAGTKAGITAIQLDVKVPGITLDICRETFIRARAARSHILHEIAKVIPSPREQISQFAPRINTVQIPVEKIGDLIGPGGKVIKKLMAETETAIDVREDGSVFVSGTRADGVVRALNWISSLGKEVIPGEIYEGTVVRIQPFGVFVNILPGKDGLVHVSQMGHGFVSDPSQVVREGQVVRVWVTEIDSQGRINLSMLFDESGAPLIKTREEGPRASHGGKRGFSSSESHFSAPTLRRARSSRGDHRRGYDR